MKAKTPSKGETATTLLLSVVNCEGDTLNGAATSDDGEAVNSSSWAKYEGGGIVADLKSGKAGTGWSGETVICGDEKTPATLLHIDDLERTNFVDELYGDSHDNNFYARKGADKVFGREGDDRIEVNGADDTGAAARTPPKATPA